MSALAWICTGWFIVVASFNSNALILCKLLALINFRLGTSLIKLMRTDTSYLTWVFKKVVMTILIRVALEFTRKSFAVYNNLFVCLGRFFMCTATWILVDVFKEIIFASFCFGALLFL